jgi:peptide/nickel transport system ATP-binding protein
VSTQGSGRSGGPEGATHEVMVDVDRLRVRLAGSTVDVVDDVSFQVRAGELMGLVGESGSGKTTVALALLGHTRRGLEVAGGTVLVGGTEMVTATKQQLRQLRGAEVAYVPQDPASALNPVLKVGTQLIEVMRAHPDAVAAKGLGDPRARVAQTLDEAGLGGVPGLLNAYPHQLSGGQQQRVALAMAFALRPSVIVLDEPTTGLDVTTQRLVLDTVRSLCEAYGVAAVFVSHDLAVVGGLVNRLTVMYAGKVVENGPTALVFGAPAHPYTRKLLRAVPSPERSEALEGIDGQPPHPTRRPRGCEFAPRCPLALPACSEGPVPVVELPGEHLVRCLRTELTARPEASRAEGLWTSTKPRAAQDVLLSASGLSARYGPAEVLSDVGLSVGRNECVAVVGESGSGKTTLARCLVGLHGSWSGEVRFAGEVLPRTADRRSRRELQAMQFIFQNPYTSLNPRSTIGGIVELPLAHFFPSLTRSERDERVSRVLQDVALGPDFSSRYPDQLSGGERQRVAIARALVVSPDLLVCDEITSSLDVSVQATIVELLRRLQAERQLSLLFITHNLALVRSIAQSVLVLSKGRVVESGPVARVFERPEDPYTVRLMEDVPKLPRGGRDSGPGSGPDGRLVAT